jgi:polyhydroxybutyrate depolymerase
VIPHRSIAPPASLILFALALLPLGLAQPDLATFEHAGLERSYTLHLPNDTAPTAPAPLVLVLHGRTGTGAGTARLTGFDERADAHGFLALYPDGVGNEWSYAHGIPGYQGPDDAEFLMALIDDIAARYPVDLDRLYVTGISNGGFMVQRLACEFPDRFAAFASVAAGGFGGMELAADARYR